MHSTAATADSPSWHALSLQLQLTVPRPCMKPRRRPAIVFFIDIILYHRYICIYVPPVRPTRAPELVCPNRETKRIQYEILLAEQRHIMGLRGLDCRLLPVPSIQRGPVLSGASTFLKPMATQGPSFHSHLTEPPAGRLACVEAPPHRGKYVCLGVTPFRCTCFGMCF